jgi:hypothetical protein
MPGQIPVATRLFSDYVPWPYLTETAVQDAIPTESYGNFGLEGLDFRSEPDSLCGRLRLRMFHGQSLFVTA